MAATDFNVSGISLKFWRVTSLPDDNDKLQTQETCTFILPENSEATVDAVQKLLVALSQIENIFPDLNKCLEELETVEIKQELNLKKDLEEIELKAVKGESSVKDEPDFIDDEEAEVEYIKYRRKRKKLSRSYQKSEKKSCLKCGKVFVWRKKYVIHLKHCNPDQLEEEPDQLLQPEANTGGNGSNPGPFCCDKCPHVFQKISAYESHLRAHELSAVLKESKANTIIEETTDPGLDIKGEAESVFVSSLPLSEPYQLQNRCETCDLAYPNYQMYKQHMDQFHKKSLSCPDCDLRFTYENTLLKHKLDYHTLYPKQCNQCTQVFLTAKTLYEHIDVHTKHLNPKTSPCEICGKLLKDKYTLKAHVEAVHEKRAGGDFACEQCGKMLKSKSSLSYHKKSAHTQDYPHRCDVCGKGYIKYNRMVNCLNNHQGIFKYRCPECDYKTNKLIQFKEHVNMHTGEKSYYCPVCRHKSNGTKNLGCHIKQVHKMTLCQAEVAYRTNRFGEQLTEDQIDDMKVRMSSLSNYNEKIVQDLKITSDHSGILPQARGAQQL
jgi:hypothetical protein